MNVISTQEMHVDMKNDLPSFFINIKEELVPFEFGFICHLLSNHDHVSHKGLIPVFHTRYRIDVVFGDNQLMHFGFGADVIDHNDLVVFIHFAAGEIAGDDATKNTIGFHAKRKKECLLYTLFLVSPQTQEGIQNIKNAFLTFFWQGFILLKRSFKNASPTKYCFAMKINIIFSLAFALFALSFSAGSAKAIYDSVLRFFDVPENHDYAEAIYYLAENDILDGFDDGSFRPEEHISRAAFTKIIIGSRFSQEEIDSCIVNEGLSGGNVFFDDVPRDQWFAPYVCIAKSKGVVNGFPDGTFGPEKKIVFPAAAKIVALAFSLEMNLEEDPWYKTYIESLGNKSAIPPDVQNIAYQITRQDMAEMAWRLKENIIDRPSSSPATIMGSDCIPFDSENLLRINMQTVRKAWLSWYNDERRNANLPAYTLSEQLNRTATIWSEHSAKKDVLSHKRPGQTAYYDYAIITDWFKNLGVEFANINGVTYSENIGRGPWLCEEEDCTTEMVNAVRETFESYLAEENQSSRPHYNAIFNPFFTQMGVGITIDKETQQYFITTHFASDFTRISVDLCM